MSGAFTIGREPFVETLDKVGRAASRDETRPILTGVLMTILGDTLKMVATDSYRLAVKETKLDHALETEVQAIVPVKALSEVARLAATIGAGDLEVAIGENQALFKLGRPGRRRVGRLAAHRRPVPQLQATAARHVRPRGHARRRTSFMAAARRVSLLAQKNAPLRLSFARAQLTMKALTQDVGQAEESLDVEFAGETFEIGFNPAYLIEGIDAVDDADVLLRFTSPLRPGLISGAGDDFVYLIMPIRLSS